MGKFRLTTILMVAILTAAAALRVAAIRSGAQNGDESFVITHALAITSGDLNPHVFYYGSFTFYLFKAISVVARVCAAAAGKVLTVADYYLLFRFASATFGTAMVFLGFLLGTLAVDRTVGLVTAGLLAFSPLGISLSSIATVDSLVGFWAAAAWVAMSFWATSTDGWAPYTVGITTGVAIATKYNAAFLFLPITLLALTLNRSGSRVRVPSRTRRLAFVGFNLAALAACCVLLATQGSLLAALARWTTTGRLRPAYIHLFKEALAGALLVVAGGLSLVIGMRRRSRTALWIVDTLTGAVFLRPVLTALVVFFLLEPFAVLDYRTSVSDISFQIQKTVSGGRAALAEDARLQLEATAGPEASDRLYYIRAVAKEWGVPVFLVMLLGLCSLNRVRPEIRLPFGATLLVMLAMTTGWGYKATRYLYPLWPLLSMLGALGARPLFERIGPVFRMLLPTRTSGSQSS